MLVPFANIFQYFDPSFIQLSLNEVWKPDLVSVVTMHMVYFFGFARSEIIQKTPGNWGWVAGNFIQASMGLIMSLL